ncbi:hypothetical protein PHYPSEUDO_000050 [Phytophthora pseudosyringae]|uniref:Uncharacterized protein n=1 Tax=Phytophthora pseudosyringae TaxID=221518 RepID=A0A8T1WPI7_9STRA|nr:hypothetical protein PHYPSEUDO_000050 [Phytophthora pseudosyringae]
MVAAPSGCACRRSQAVPRRFNFAVSITHGFHPFFRRRCGNSTPYVPASGNDRQSSHITLSTRACSGFFRERQLANCLGAMPMRDLKFPMRANHRPGCGPRMAPPSTADGAPRWPPVAAVSHRLVTHPPSQTRGRWNSLLEMVFSAGCNSQAIRGGFPPFLPGVSVVGGSSRFK